MSGFDPSGKKIQIWKSFAKIYMDLKKINEVYKQLLRTTKNEFRLEEEWLNPTKIY